MRNDRDVCKKPEKRVRYMRDACTILDMRARYETCAQDTMRACKMRACKT